MKNDMTSEVIECLREHASFKCIEGNEKRMVLAAADLLEAKDAQLDDAAKDTAALIEIDKVMLESGAHWPDLETDALVVRSVKEMTRMLNAALVTPATTPGAPEQTDNIISLVQRLALALRQANPIHPLPEKAIDYLRSAGVIVSPLRKVVQPCTGCNGRGEVGGLRQDGYHSEMCPCCQGSGQEQP